MLLSFRFFNIAPANGLIKSDLIVVSESLSDKEVEIPFNISEFLPSLTSSSVQILSAEILRNTLLIISKSPEISGLYIFIFSRNETCLKESIDQVN